ncbi:MULTISPECIES: MBL fold metallo-hydrolase [unclassified Novosphingobium]|uniref:MBL fold metallo-hydrolase n=1 Tax=unclassified Novosphingobium TaxID=2644732 RepID=UPI000F5D7856|nr:MULTISPECIES: MBL fold metallo-hydrolase [unclassified Novosphingobium]MBF5092962.1 MBL fold metallo-hydrolase [Novosphingobium sp. NBM11]RQW43697.1 MBL fold metallo-hydrolase [Novosphingobium sp. LASN5T]
MANWAFTQGVHDIGNGVYGYVQPDGTWGWSNAGLIVSRGETLLVDTLMSRSLTRTMLADFARVDGGDHIDRLVNTHANPDHFVGNGLVEGAEIIATVETAREMGGFDPVRFASLADNWQAMGDAGAFLYETMGRKFDWSDLDSVAMPNRTFEQSLQLSVGDTAVELIDLGPAHTASDTIAWLPQQRVVFTGDLLFNEGHPIMWDGPIENWIAACEHIIALDPEVVVPGHGPITDTVAVANLRDYFGYVRDEARRRFEAGMGWKEAGRDINMAEYRGWTDPERIVANVFALYRQWGAPLAPEDGADLFGEMGRYASELAAHEGCGHDH